MGPERPAMERPRATRIFLGRHRGLGPRQLTMCRLAHRSRLSRLSPATTGRIPVDSSNTLMAGIEAGRDSVAVRHTRRSAPAHGEGGQNGRHVLRRGKGGGRAWGGVVHLLSVAPDLRHCDGRPLADQAPDGRIRHVLDAGHPDFQGVSVGDLSGGEPRAKGRRRYCLNEKFRAGVSGVQVHVYPPIPSVEH